MAAARCGRAAFWMTAMAVMTAVSGQTTEAAAVCGTGPSVAATVFAVLLLLALAALGIVMYQYIWKPRHCPSLEKVVLAENGQQEGRFAFDNPYMIEDDDIGSKSTLPCHDILAINEKTGTSRSGDFRTPKRHGFCVITPTSSQPRGQSSDDSPSNEADQVTVPLKGHDFTGLGFTVQGGMREGIFVHTVSQHGPALESGLVQPGDRVTAVTVSFSHITLEDAQAILSQSSPYNVQLHLQKSGSEGTQKKSTTPTGTGDRRQGSSSDLTEGKSHRPGQSDKSPETGSSTSTSSPNEYERKTAAETKGANESRKETVQHVQRDPSVSGGFREVAVDVPENMDSPQQKQNTEAASGLSSAAKARHLGIQVLPPLTPTGGAGGSGTPGSESRDGRRNVALGIPSLRLAARDSTDSGHCVETCLTKVANDQPCSRNLDDETGEPSVPGADETRRVRMGMSSFNKQERLERKEMDNQPDKPEPAKRQSLGDSAVEAGVNVEVKSQNDSAESGKSPDEQRQLYASRDSTSPEQRVSEKEGEDDVEFKKLSSEFSTLIHEDEPQPDDVKPVRDTDIGSAEKEPTKSHRSGSNPSSSSGHSSPVQDRPKQVFEIPDEMRLAAGVAQDRRSRVDRPARSAMFGSTEVLVEHQMTPTMELPTTVSIDLEDDSQDERVPPVAMPRTVTPDTHLSENKTVDSDSETEASVNKLDDSDNVREISKQDANYEKPTSSSRDEKDDVAKPVEEEELKRTVRSIAAYEDDAPLPKMKIDKLEVFKEVLSLTPSKSPPEKRAKQEEQTDVVGETVEKNHVDRCPCDGPTSNSTVPRITGEVTGLVEVGERKSAKTTSVTESKPRPAESGERAVPPTSAAVSRARSEAAALPEAVRAIRTVRRRDSGGLAAEVLSRDAAAASGRLCASTGDLTRSEPPRADSPLGRTVSMQIGVGDHTDGDSRVSAAACARDQMDLSRLQEVTHPRHIMSVASSNESLDTESIQEEPEDAADHPPPPPPGTNNGINDHGPEDEDEARPPSVVLIEAPSGKETTLEVTVNGIGGEEEHREDKAEESSRHSSGDEDAREHVRVPSLPRIVQSELKRGSESDTSDGREEPSTAARESVPDDAIAAPSVASAMVAPPIVINPAPGPTGTREDTTAESSPVTAPSAATPDAAQSVTGGAVETGTAGAVETGTAGDTTPVGRSRRGPPPTPPPRSPASRQVAPSAPSRQPDQFEISAMELDSVMISHEEFLRQEAERRAHVCRLAVNFRTSREPSPARE